MTRVTRAHYAKHTFRGLLGAGGAGVMFWLLQHAQLSIRFDWHGGTGPDRIIQPGSTNAGTYKLGGDASKGQPGAIAGHLVRGPQAGASSATGSN